MCACVHFMESINSNTLKNGGQYQEFLALGAGGVSLSPLSKLPESHSDSHSVCSPLGLSFNTFGKRSDAGIFSNSSNKSLKHPNGMDTWSLFKENISDGVSRKRDINIEPTRNDFLNFNANCESPTESRRDIEALYNEVLQSEANLRSTVEDVDKQLSSCINKAATFAVTYAYRQLPQSFSGNEQAYIPPGEASMAARAVEKLVGSHLNIEETESESESELSSSGVDFGPKTRYGYEPLAKKMKLSDDEMFLCRRARLHTKWNWTKIEMKRVDLLMKNLLALQHTMESSSRMRHDFSFQANSSLKESSSDQMNNVVDNPLSRKPLRLFSTLTDNMCARTRSITCLKSLKKHRVISLTRSDGLVDLLNPSSPWFLPSGSSDRLVRCHCRSPDIGPCIFCCGQWHNTEYQREHISQISKSQRESSNQHVLLRSLRNRAAGLDMSFHPVLSSLSELRSVLCLERMLCVDVPHSYRSLPYLAPTLSIISKTGEPLSLAIVKFLQEKCVVVDDGNSSRALPLGAFSREYTRQLHKFNSFVPRQMHDNSKLYLQDSTSTDGFVAKASNVRISSGDPKCMKTANFTLADLRNKVGCYANLKKSMKNSRKASYSHALLKKAHWTSLNRMRSAHRSPSVSHTVCGLSTILNIRGQKSIELPTWVEKRGVEADDGRETSRHPSISYKHIASGLALTTVISSSDIGSQMNGMHSPKFKLEAVSESEVEDISDAVYQREHKKEWDNEILRLQQAMKTNSVTQLQQHHMDVHHRTPAYQAVGYSHRSMQNPRPPYQPNPGGGHARLVFPLSPETLRRMRDV